MAKAKAKSPRAAGASNHRRAPRRVGRRTTLTLPGELLEQARRLADELDTSINDAVIRLAMSGAERHAEALELERRIRRRRAALSSQREQLRPQEHPSEEEVRAAVLTMREGD